VGRFLADDAVEEEAVTPVTDDCDDTESIDGRRPTTGGGVELPLVDRVTDDVPFIPPPLPMIIDDGEEEGVDGFRPLTMVNERSSSAIRFRRNASNCQSKRYLQPSTSTPRKPNMSLEKQAI
jgi:hypothetical protein